MHYQDSSEQLFDQYLIGIRSNKHPVIETYDAPALNDLTLESFRFHDKNKLDLGMFKIINKNKIDVDMNVPLCEIIGANKLSLHSDEEDDEYMYFCNTCRFISTCNRENKIIEGDG